MTIEDVIYQLESLKKDRESFFRNDGDDEIFRLDADACEVAAVIMERYIPKRPIKFPKMIFYRCPACGRSVGITEYCHHCGQALDWQ